MINNRLNNLGCALQKPLNWGVDHFKKTPNNICLTNSKTNKTKSESKQAFLKKVKTVVLRMLEMIAAVFSVVFGTIPYAIGSGLKLAFKKAEVIEKQPKERQPKPRRQRRKNLSSQRAFKAQNLVEMTKQELEQMKLEVEKKLETATLKTQRRANEKRLNKINLALKVKLPVQAKKRSDDSDQPVKQRKQSNPKPLNDIDLSDGEVDTIATKHPTGLYNPYALLANLDD